MEAVSQWAQSNFGSCVLGDKRRTRRLVTLAEQVGANTSASLPDQTPAWSDLKSAYRLLANDAVSFEAIATPHWQQTRRRSPGRYLIIGDTTELDFGYQRQISGLGPTGNGYGKGFLLHSGMMVNADSSEIIGMAGQTIHYRPLKKKKKKENASQRLSRKRESEVWGKVIDQVGPPPQDAQFIHVFDRGGDNFETFCHLVEQKSDWVVRGSQLHRNVLAGESQEKIPLKEFLPSLEVLGSYTLELRTRDKQPAREAKLEVRVGKLKLPRPQHVSPWVRQRDPQPIAMNVIHVVEVDAAKNVTPISWVLLTSLPVETFEQTWEAIEFYESRWLIEEYHKALKTGCRVEQTQLKTAGSLEALMGLMSVVAVRILSLKTIANKNPDLPARKVVPPIWLQVLKAARKKLTRVNDLTVRQFFREVAILGGFIGRKSDGEPGWITIWRGWNKLNNYVHAVSIAEKLKTQ